MKTLLALAAVAALASSPALAKPAHQQKHAQDANAQEQTLFASRRRLNPNDVYVDGRYAGTDPDPVVRLQIQRDYNDTYYGD